MSTEAVKLHIDDTGGTGRPVVLIHGWPLASESWSEQVRPLQDAGHRVITYDRRGFGRSEKPQDGYDYDTLADDLDHVIRSLDLHDVTLVGFSMGGGEVARYASRHGLDRVHSVVFAAAVPPFLQQSSNNPDGPLDDETFQGLRGSLEKDRDSFFEDFTTGFFSVGRTSWSAKSSAKRPCRWPTSLTRPQHWPAWTHGLTPISDQTLVR